MAFDLVFSDKGITQPSASSIKEELEQMFANIWGSGINLDASSKQGQLITSLTTIILEKNSAIMKAIQSFNPATAKNDDESGLFWQDAIGNLYLMERLPATKTSVLCYIGGRAGTVIPSTAQVISDNGDIFQIGESVTIPTNGSVGAYFYAVESGSIDASANTIKTIYTPVVGWDTVNNPSTGVIGSDIESRENFENRRIELLSRYSTNQVESISSEIASIEGVTRYLVKENDTDDAISIQNKQLTAHSIYCVVEGGTANKIGQAIRLRKSAGCSTNGTQVYNDYYGNIYFDLPRYVNVRVSVNATKTSTTPSDIIDTIKKTLVDNMSATGSDLLGIGETLYAGRFIKALSDLDINLSSVTVGVAGSGSLGTSVSFDLDQIGSLNEQNITVNIS